MLAYTASIAVHICLFFFFNDTATTEIYTLSLHDALPIYLHHFRRRDGQERPEDGIPFVDLVFERIGEHHTLLREHPPDRKSTRLNSSHGYISYAVFCLKKKKKELYYH